MTLSHEELVSEIKQLSLSHDMITEENFELKGKLETIRKLVYEYPLSKDEIKKVFEE